LISSIKVSTPIEVEVGNGGGLAPG
jgi:hypothetical protein